MIRRAALPMVMAVAAALACSRRQPAPAPQPQPEPVRTQPAAAPDTAGEGARRAAAAAAERARLRATIEEMVFFDYDESRIRSDAEATLQGKLPILRANAEVAIRITGHADERGSIEYNLALGLRRANAVRDYLAGFGIDASRMATETLGEERPLVPASNEAAWARNRRAEFTITRGGDTMVSPGR